MTTHRIALALLAASLTFLAGCATRPAGWDYTAYQRAKPRSLLVLPPVSEAPDIKATPGVWSQVTRPLAEAGYYVLPVTLVDATFRENGVTTAHDAQEIPVAKLRDFFGADAAVYMKIKKYGTTYQVLASETRVEVEARILDLRSGELLWQGSAFASSAEQQQSQGGLAGLLVAALVNQIVGTTTDAAYNYAGIASARLMAAPRHNGVLPGPRSPLYGQPPAP
ncbi:MAG TPA: DUF799 domain-containing protein [Ramlibacter sp.]|jgi:hypothetical protein|uniref:DUF799 domain-containing protein n=1 Tax=Ramlibacter sp. TaxID=1917967 RepID=UPI002D5705C3|nr:DUF799 domain-containing protein [Ramlibacter sp.]HZY18335.1 DUF799 domain-containing protein [Ramlibacter sp.]